MSGPGGQIRSFVGALARSWSVGLDTHSGRRSVGHANPTRLTAQMLASANWGMDAAPVIVLVVLAGVRRCEDFGW